MKTTLLALCSLIVPAIAAGAAAPTVLKVGTLAPKDTSFYKALQTMGETWTKETKGAVSLNIFPSGTAGSEAEAVARFRNNSLQAALLTGVGLMEIEKSVAGLQSIPMGFRSLEELDYVSDKLRPVFEQKMAAKGYIVLFWVDGGWIRFFSKQPVTHPADLKKMKLFTWAGNPEQEQLYRSGGFNPVPLETNDIVTSIRTPMLDAAPMPPFFANSLQLGTAAPYMLELNWAPIVGAFVVSKTAWDSLAPETREIMKRTGAAAAREITLKGRKESDDAAVAMAKRGMTVTKVTPAVEEEWRGAAEALYPQIRGHLVPEAIFDEALAHMKDFRAGKRN